MFISFRKTENKSLYQNIINDYNFTDALIIISLIDEYGYSFEQAVHIVTKS